MAANIIDSNGKSEEMLLSPAKNHQRLDRHCFIQWEKVPKLVLQIDWFLLLPPPNLLTE